MKASSKIYILVINGGSSSLKFGIYRMVDLKLEISGSVKHIGSAHAHMEIIAGGQSSLMHPGRRINNIVDAARVLIHWLKNDQAHFSIAAIGHRVVQGGPAHREPELITDGLLNILGKFSYLAPNHLPDEIKTIKVFGESFLSIPQVACFDTAFHRNMPEHAKSYALPIAYREQGLIRYGFHGLSYEYILQRLKKTNVRIHKKKIIIAHLGNGASMAAVKNGISIDTTMGFSPAGGLIMGTRPGDLDPGVMLLLMKGGKLKTRQIDDLLNKNSGLKAIAGISDMQELIKAKAEDPKAAEALTLFCYQAKKFIGALAAAMGGLDMLVFTGGIGENSAFIRRHICLGLKFLGMAVSESSNQAMKETISTKASQIIVKVLKTDEEVMIAQHTQRIIKQ